MRRQALGIVAYRGLGSLLQAALLIILARGVTPADFGRVNSSIGLFLFLGVVFDAGLTGYSVRVWAVERDAGGLRSSLMGNWYSALALLVFVLTWTATQQNDIGVGARWGILASAVWATGEKVSEGQMSLFVAEQKILVPGVSVILRRVPSVIVVLLNPLGDVLMSYALGVAIGTLLGVSFSAAACRWRLAHIERGTPTSVFGAFRAAVPFNASNIFAQARNLDGVIISSISGAAAAGMYGSASRLASPLFLLSTALASSIIPAIGRGGVVSIARIDRMIIKGLAAGSAMLVMLYPISDSVMTLFFGPEYSGNGLVLILISVGTLLNALQSPLSAVLLGAGHYKFASFAGLFAALSVLGSIAVGAGLGGELGGSIGYLIGSGLGIGLFLLCVHRLEIDEAGSCGA